MPDTVQAPIETAPPPLLEEEKRSNKIIYLLVSIVVLLAILVVGALVYFSSKKPSQTAQVPQTNTITGISGTLDFNGVAPEGSTVSIGVTTPSSPNVQTVDTGISPSDSAAWSWSGAVPGSIYQVVAYLNYNGQIIAQSSPLVLAAPAQGEALVINVNSNSIPSTASPSPSTASTSVSGTVGIDGYVPAGSTLSVAVAPIGQLPLNTVSSGILATDGASWSWNGAIVDQEYQVQASIVQNQVVIAQSQIATMSAPAANEVLSINSTAQPPAPAAVGISGTINLNGNIPSGSYITLGYRITGSPTFTPVSGNLSSSDNVSWSIPSLSSGTSYDVQAYLWVNNQPFSQSQILTVPAPAANEVLNINSTQSPSTPNNNTISASCGGSQNNNWQANITYNTGGSISNAQQYQITIGTSSQNNNVYTTTVSPSNPSQQQSISTPYILNNNVTYYVQYAYSTCQTCGTFSSFSPSVAITCN